MICGVETDIRFGQRTVTWPRSAILEPLKVEGVEHDKHPQT